MVETIEAWHFVGEKLRDGSSVPEDGVTLKHTSKLKLCSSGFHASIRAIDALFYAPGSTICKVRLGGTIIHSDDKLVASERTILWRVSEEKLLRKFAKQCALDVVHLWDCPPIVLKYLKSKSEKDRDAAGAAARAAARAAAEAAAWTAAEAAARAAARAAAGAAARAAARAAAGAAAEAAAWTAAETAAEAAVRAAARDKQNKYLEKLVYRAKDKRYD